MPTPMTVEGAELLRGELQLRKAEKRHVISRAIAAAREHGDLRENAEYHAAKELQSFNEGRILEIEARLADAQVIDVTKLPPSGKVIFGVTVTLTAEGAGDSIRYKIVGEDEADLKAGKLSIMSPIARALIGKAVGDEVRVHAPSGETAYAIDAVEHL